MSISLSSTIRFAIVALLVVAAGYIMTPNQAAAQVNIPAAGVDLEGFAWSPTVGWISFNCTNTSTCAADGGIDYAVTLESGGNLVDHAWTSSIGWIDFDPAGPYPGGAGTTNASAQAIGGDFTSTLLFGGWARACAVFQNPSACSGPLDPNAGGWDGWISLVGSAGGGYGITMEPSGATANSYAWGGPLVTGWIDFSPIGATPVQYKADPAPVVTILTPTAPQPAGPVTITFDPIGPGGTPDSCTISDGSVTNPITPTPATNSESVTVNVTTDTTYTITCTNPSGSGSDTVTVDVYGDLVLGPVTVTPGSVNAAGDYDTVNFTANVSGVPAGTPVPYTLTLDGDSITGTLNGSGVLVVDEDFTSVPFSATPLSWTLVVDPTSGPGDRGVVDEGGLDADEVDNNSDDGALTLSAPDPTITIDVESIVRTGTAVDVEVTISTVGETTCELFGPGLTSTPPFTFTVPAGSVNYSLTPTPTTDPLQNSTSVAVRCSVAGGGSPVTQGESIEVTPSFQEV